MRAYYSKVTLQSQDPGRIPGIPHSTTEYSRSRILTLTSGTLINVNFLPTPKVHKVNVNVVYFLAQVMTLNVVNIDKISSNDPR